MPHHLIQIAFSVALSLLVASSLNALEVPIVKQTTIEVPYKDYTVIRFPFKVTKIQAGTFTYKREKTKKIAPVNPNGVKQITLTKQKGASAANIKTLQNNPLNLRKIDKMLTLRPIAKGETEVIVWGNAEFPMIVKIKVVDKADKNIDFIQILDKRSEVITFESSPHEKVIENIMRFLYNSEVNKKPSGYENVARKELYDVAIKDRNGDVFARVRVSLSKEVVGRRYTGQVWNVNIVPEFDNEHETIEIPEGFRLSLYEEMFDKSGVFAISLETYRVTKEHGTRLMIVRANK